MDNVFLVHGRNKQIIRAVKLFLTSIGIHPISWEEAVQYTGKGAPDTLEVVKKGIEMTKATIVLFSGDDFVHLRPEFGSEQNGFQARPNVILEAGLALGLVGPERTIFLRTGDHREISDLKGINYINLGNSFEERNAVVARLKTAGLNAIVESDSYMNLEISGDFESRIPNKRLFSALEKELVPKPEILGIPTNAETPINQNRIATEAIITFIPDKIAEYTKLCDYLEHNHNFDMKYNYIGVHCAENWLNLSNDPSYGHNELVDFYLKRLPSLIKHIPISIGDRFDLVSLGAGSGEIDMLLLKEVLGKTNRLAYFPFDISIELLQKCIGFFRSNKWLKFEKMQPVHGDFHDLVAYKKYYNIIGASHRVFMLAGFTLGNHDESQLLGKIEEGMDIGDYLIVDLRLHDYANPNIHDLDKEKEKEQIIRNYKGMLNNRFAFGPIEDTTNAEFDNSQIYYTISSQNTVVPNAFNVVTNYRSLVAVLKNGVQSISRTKIALASTTLYSKNAFFLWLEHRFLEAITVEASDDKMIVLLRKYE